MKNVMVLIVLIFLGNALFAQDGNERSSEEYEKQIGLSATNFFLRFISFNQMLENTPDILFLYKKGTGGKKTRHSLGGRISLHNSSDEDDERTMDRLIQLSYRFGKENYRNFYKRWGILYGWETHYRGSFSKSTDIDFSFNGSINRERTRTNSTFSFSTGVRALGGIQFRINDRLSLLTETSYGISLFYRNSKSKTQIENEDSNEGFNKSYSINTFFNAPISIIVNYHF